MAAAVASPPLTPVAPAKSADFDYLRYQEKIKEYVVKVRTTLVSSDSHSVPELLRLSSTTLSRQQSDLD